MEKYVRKYNFLKIYSIMIKIKYTCIRYIYLPRYWTNLPVTGSSKTGTNPVLSVV